ncbi:MAG: aminotransferase class V-fold PLP-dependent enzyme [Blastocatellia bacterium]|nr:aminotransferase class V-fold PLP-dependent enzyme [Blastocatellia bacterium]
MSPAVLRTNGFFSPEGCGIIYLSERARTRIEPTLVGWISVETPWDFDDYEQNWKANALAWETGTGGSSLFYGMEQSLKILNEIGAEKIQIYLEELTDKLCELLLSKIIS